MNTEQKRYILVFTGIFLIILGGLIYLNSSKKTTVNDEKKAQILAFIETNKVERPENIFKPCEKPSKLNFIYDEHLDFKRSIPLDAGMKSANMNKYLNNLKVVCSGKNCRNQVVTVKDTYVLKKTRTVAKKINVIEGNLEITAGHVKKIKSDTVVKGDLYIVGVNFLRVPKNFKVYGNIYLVDSEGLTFMGNNYIDGNIYLSGHSSIRAFPKTMKMTGQIFI